MWQLVTSVSNKEQGMTLLLDFLEGIYSRKSCGKPAVHLTARELNTNAGIDVLFSTLGEVLPCITDNEKDSSIVYDDLNFQKVKPALAKLFLSSQNAQVNQQQQDSKKFITAESKKTINTKNLVTIMSKSVNH